MTTTGNMKKGNVKKRAVGKPGLANSDDYARAIIAEGKRVREDPDQALDHPVITSRGIMIALATALVESNMLIYANHDDPESLKYPHDVIGIRPNEKRVGLFKQNASSGGSVADRMDAERSAALFYHALARLDYSSTAHPPSWYAQRVQQSPYPDLYDQRFAEALRLYTRLVRHTRHIARPDFNEHPKWSPNYYSRCGTKIDLWLLHTEEGNSTADQLADYLNKPASEVSYHYTISDDPNDGGVTVCEVVDTDCASWSVKKESNKRSINLCFDGSRIAWTRQQWLDKAAKAIDVAAYLAVRDCQKCGIPIKVIKPPYLSDPPGISDHRYCTDHLKDGNTHTDVGNNFPWDVFESAVNKYAGIVGPGPAPTPAQPLDDAHRTSAVADLVKRVAALEKSAASAPAKAAAKKAPRKRTKSPGAGKN
jgi:N-acetyl-anhydromuramyl-L-alanine amidase AmpD